jgi:hypothetical protein
MYTSHETQEDYKHFFSTQDLLREDFTEQLVKVEIITKKVGRGRPRMVPSALEFDDVIST